MSDRRIRVGIDTGGTFTDVVAVDEDTGEVATTKTPTTPGDPSVGFMAGLAKVLAMLGAGPESLAAVSHGTTVATNRLLEGKVENLGFVTTEGYDQLLEIARQSVPDGYGNSYFWVKPPRIVPADLVCGVGGRLAYDGREIRPFDEASAVAAALYLKAAGVLAVGVCFLHSYANPAHEELMREVLARHHPDAVVSLSSDVLREYREYERSVTTLVDAAVKPSIRSYVASIRSQARHLRGQRLHQGRLGALRRDEVQRGRAVGGRGREAADHDRPVGAGGGSPRRRPGRPSTAGFHTVVTCDGGGTSTDVTLVVDGRPTLTTEGSIGAYPSKIADDRRRHRRRRRGVDRRA